MNEGDWCRWKSGMDDDRRLVTVGNSLQHDRQGLDKIRQDSEGKNKPRFHSAEERHVKI